jgi:hypothetical protein
MSDAKGWYLNGFRRSGSYVDFQNCRDLSRAMQLKVYDFRVI